MGWLGSWNPLLGNKQELRLVLLIRRVVWLKELSVGTERGGERAFKPFEAFLILPVVKMAHNFEPSFQASHHTSQERRPRIYAQCPTFTPLFNFSLILTSYAPYCLQFHGSRQSLGPYHLPSVVITSCNRLLCLHFSPGGIYSCHS